MSTGSRPPFCVPTWRGYIETTKDALLVVEACFQGVLHHCSRRPHDRERSQLIVSGNVFVYEEATSGIKRWTDGIPWSPSRILTNFLIYRQLNSPFPPGEKKRATKRNQRSSRPGEPYSTPTSSQTTTPTTDDHKPFAGESPETPGIRREDDGQDKDANRGLVGSLVDSYEFKEGGLLKKTMTVTVRNVQHHLVSYYSLEDAKFNLKTPRDDPRLKDLPISEALLKQPKFKFPNLDDAGDGTFESMNGAPGQYPGYYPVDQGRGYAPAPYGYGYSGAVPYAHPGAYAPHYPPAAAYAPVPQAGPSHAPSAQYSHQQQPQQPHQQHPQQQGYQQYYQQPPMQNVPQYHQPGYAQHYSAHQPPPHSSAQVASVKQEPSPQNATPQYAYSNGSQQSHAGGEVFSPMPPNGSNAQQEDHGATATQPQGAQNWPANTYNQQWAGRADQPGYAAYRPPG